MTRLTLLAEDAGALPRPVAPDPSVVARLLLRAPEVEATPEGTRYAFRMEGEELEELRAQADASGALVALLEEVQALERRLAVADAPGPARLLRAAAQALLAEAMARRLDAPTSR